AENPTDFPRLGVSYTSNIPGDPTVDQGIQSNVRGDSNRWLENGSYLRVSNVQLGYNLPKHMLERCHMLSLLGYVTGHVLLTITKYGGRDPDVVGENGDLDAGVDVLGLPPTRLVSFGIAKGM